MICPNCKKELADNAKVCPQCGYDFLENVQKRGCGCTIAIIIFLAIIAGLFVNWLIS
ncbi:MAG: zinc-ribbon domain-containing protein [Clostridium sp.]|nr:zinc-ribbon domain-containing protein [Clostridium sp.]